MFAPVAPAGSFEFRVGDDVASIVDGEARPGPLDDADVVVTAPDPAAFYHLFVDRRWDEIEVEGDRELLERLLDAASAPATERPCRPSRSGYAPAMCRNIRTLHNFEPSATEEEIRDAALQYVRKVSGMQKPSRANADAFDRAVDDITAATARLLDALVTTAPPRDREVEAERRRARSAERFGRAA